MRNKITYSGPLALYISYFVLLALSISLIAISFKLDVESQIFLQIFFTGVATFVISGTLILYATHIAKGIDAEKWRLNANTYYNDEGDFEYLYNGFSLITKNDESLSIKWIDIAKIESYERRIKDLKISCIDLYFSEKEFMTIDSTIAGFNLFEKRLKENMRHIWKDDTQTQPNPEVKHKSAINHP